MPACMRCSLCRNSFHHATAAPEQHALYKTSDQAMVAIGWCFARRFNSCQHPYCNLHACCLLQEPSAAPCPSLPTPSLAPPPPPHLAHLHAQLVQVLLLGDCVPVSGGHARAPVQIDLGGLRSGVIWCPAEGDGVVQHVGLVRRWSNRWLAFGAFSQVPRLMKCI